MDRTGRTERIPGGKKMDVGGNVGKHTGRLGDIEPNGVSGMGCVPEEGVRAEWGSGGFCRCLLSCHLLQPGLRLNPMPGEPNGILSLLCALMSCLSELPLRAEVRTLPR